MLFGLALAASLSSCGIEQGRYQLRTDSAVTARFHAVERSPDWPSGLALEVHFAHTNRSYWFLPWQGGTDGRTNIAWVREEHSPIEYQSVRRDMQFFATDANYNIDDEVPRSGRVAPVHMLLPDLATFTWYSTTSSERDGLARAFFDLTECVSARPEAAPPRIEFPAVP